MFGNFLKKVFGTKSKRDVKRMLPLVATINALEVSYQSLSDDELKNKTLEFKERLAKGETTDDIMCEAFAVVKNACRRLCGSKVMVCDHELEWNMIPFDVQVHLHYPCLRVECTAPEVSHEEYYQASEHQSYHLVHQRL